VVVGSICSGWLELVDRCVYSWDDVVMVVEVAGGSFSGGSAYDNQ
jgi:hypothetical protein